MANQRVRPFLLSTLRGIHRHSWSRSFEFHFVLYLLIAFQAKLWPFLPGKAPVIDLSVIEAPQLAMQDLSRTPPPPPTPPKKQPKPRAVFGLSRKSLTADSTETQAPEVKAGNTTAKAPDLEKLNPDDADSLPIPADEYLVSEMPVLINDYRAPYPPEAKKKGIEGAVVFELLIDATGKVRQAVLLDGPGAGLNEAAETAVRNLLFKPARVAEQFVAVKIRYAYRFVLER
jgi:protein TonB